MTVVGLLAVNNAETRFAGLIAVASVSYGQVIGRNFALEEFPKVEAVEAFGDHVRLFYSNGMIANRAWSGTSIVVRRGELVAATGAVPLFRVTRWAFGENLGPFMETARAGGATVGG